MSFLYLAQNYMKHNYDKLSAQEAVAAAFSPDVLGWYTQTLIAASLPESLWTASGPHKSQRMQKLLNLFGVKEMLRTQGPFDEDTHPSQTDPITRNTDPQKVALLKVSGTDPKKIVLASDVMTARINSSGGGEKALHKPKHINSASEWHAHFNHLFGDKWNTFSVRSSVAVSPQNGRVGVAATSEHQIVYEQFTSNQINRYIRGTNPIDRRAVNGGILNEAPHIRKRIVEIDGHKKGTERFELAYFEVIRALLGVPGCLAPALLFALSDENSLHSKHTVRPKNTDIFAVYDYKSRQVTQTVYADPYAARVQLA